MRSYDTFTETFETRCWHYFLYIMKFPECKFQRCYTILETESIQKMRIKVRDRKRDWSLFTLFGSYSKLNRKPQTFHLRSKKLFFKNTIWLPWLVWLIGLSTCLWNNDSWVQFPVRAQAWVVGHVPSRGYSRGNHTLMFLSSLSPSLPLSLKINSLLKKEYHMILP